VALAGDISFTLPEQNTPRTRAKCRTIRASGRSLPVVGLAKIDVEGSEGAALEEMAGLLVRCPRLKMLVAFWPAGLTRSGYGAVRLLGLLQRLGFRAYEVGEVEMCIRRTDPRRLLDR
jgi:hypothetical protein